MRLFFIFLILLTGSFSQASFDANSRRYMSYYELMNSMNAIFLGNENLSAFLSDDCRGVTENNKADLGYNNPSTGEPIISSPNSGYIRWIGSCIPSYISALKAKDLVNVNLFSAKSLSYFKTIFNSSTVYFSDIVSVPFNTLPDEIQSDIIDHAFYLVFGPDEDFNQFALMDAKVYKAKVKSHLQKNIHHMPQALEIIMFNYLIRDEFLSY